MKRRTDTTDIWNKFEKIRIAHSEVSLRSNTEAAYRFYEGDQWYGLGSDETLPVLNFIKPVVDYKTSMVAMNAMTIDYSVLGESTTETNRITKALNVFAARNWERLKMDNMCWKIIKAAMVAGDAYVFIYDGSFHAQLIDNVDIYFGNERETDIQKQPYIIIAERRDVVDVVEDAKQNGISAELREDIVSDSEAEEYITTEDGGREIAQAGGKCTCLLYLKLHRNGDLGFCRCTRHVIYQPTQIIKGIGCYPIAPLVFNRQKGSSRGRGEVRPLINNQIEVNRNLARRLLNSKLTAFSKLVYAEDRINNPDALLEAGTAIAIKGATVENVRDYINYIAPAQMSSEASNLTAELMNVTRELAGAGDAAMGSIDPTQASGTAIIAVRDQAAIPLNAQTADFRQFVEDIAKIWLSIVRVYNPDGITIDGEKVLPADIEAIDLSIKIDVSSKAPFSKYAREQALERALANGLISFEEYVSALDHDAHAPKSAFEKIVTDRNTQLREEELKQKQAAESTLPGTMEELMAMAEQNQTSNEITEEYNGR